MWYNHREHDGRLGWNEMKSLQPSIPHVQERSHLIKYVEVPLNGQTIPIEKLKRITGHMMCAQHTSSMKNIKYISVAREDIIEDK